MFSADAEKAAAIHANAAEEKGTVLLMGWGGSKAVKTIFLRPVTSQEQSKNGVSS
jgi:hypothetical protein